MLGKVTTWISPWTDAWTGMSTLWCLLDVPVVMPGRQWVTKHGRGEAWGGGIYLGVISLRDGL